MVHIPCWQYSRIMVYGCNLVVHEVLRVQIARRLLSHGLGALELSQCGLFNLVWNMEILPYLPKKD